LWIDLVNESLHGSAHLSLDKNEIGDGDAVMVVNIARQRSECPIGHADRHRGHVLERVRHRQQKDVHSIPQNEEPGLESSRLRKDTPKPGSCVVEVKKL